MNKKTLVNTVFDDLKKEKFNAEFQAEQNLFYLRKTNKEFKYYDDLLRQTMLEYGQENFDLEKSQKLIDDLKEKRLDVLKKLGKDESFITPKRNCSLCDDTGIFKEKRCKCFNKKLQQKLLENSGLKTQILHKFSDCNEEILKGNEKLSKIYNLAKTYTEKFPDVKIPNFVFMGKVGTGKTFLLESIASALIEREFFVVYATAFNLQNTMLKAMTTSPFESDIYLSPILECDLLIVDDLGSEPIIRNISVSNLFSILNERETKNKATLISTNLSFDDIEARYGNRLFSRIFNKRKSRVLLFEGKDLRINS